eukprot:3901949-Rhodomonas_salina.1
MTYASTAQRTVDTMRCAVLTAGFTCVVCGWSVGGVWVECGWCASAWIPAAVVCAAAEARSGVGWGGQGLVEKLMGLPAIKAYYAAEQATPPN